MKTSVRKTAVAKRSALKATSKPAVAYRVGRRTHLVARSAKNGLKAAGSATASFFRTLKAGWKAA